MNWVGLDSFQRQLRGVWYHTGPHRDGGREVDEEGRPFGQGEQTETTYYTGVILLFWIIPVSK